jgi:tetratricopeptide (TPR) repeat protein
MAVWGESVDTALLKAQRAAREDPESVQALYDLAEAYRLKYVKGGSTDRKLILLALKKASDAHKLHPDAALSHAAPARVFYSMGDRERTRTHSNIAMETETYCEPAMAAIFWVEEDEADDPGGEPFPGRGGKPPEDVDPLLSEDEDDGEGKEPEPRKTDSSPAPPRDVEKEPAGASTGTGRRIEEDFSDNSRDWPLKNNAEGVLAVRNGRYHFSRKEDGGYWLCLQESITAPEESDFNIRCTARHVSGVLNYAYGLTFGAKDGDDYFEFEIAAHGVYQFSKVTGGRTRKLVEWTKSDAINKGNAVNQIEVQKRGARARLLINGQKVREVPCFDFPGQCVGLEVAGRQAIEFDDLIVEILPAGRDIEKSTAAKDSKDFCVELNSRGVGFYKKKQYGRAEETFREALRHDPDNPRPLANLAAALWRQDQVEEAAHFALSAKKSGKTDFWFYSKLAGHYAGLSGKAYKRKDYREAKSLARRGIALCPEHSSCYNQLGNAFYSESNYSAAEEAYRDALERTSTNKMAMANLAGCLWMQDRHAEAIEAAFEASAGKAESPAASKPLPPDAEAPPAAPRREETDKTPASRESRRSRDSQSLVRLKTGKYLLADTAKGRCTVLNQNGQVTGSWTTKSLGFTSMPDGVFRWADGQVCIPHGRLHIVDETGRMQNTIKLDKRQYPPGIGGVYSGLGTRWRGVLVTEDDTRVMHGRGGAIRVYDDEGGPETDGGSAGGGGFFRADLFCEE